MEKVDLADRRSRVDARWQPHVVAGDNGNDIMVARMEGESPGHDHPEIGDPFPCHAGHCTVGLPGCAPADLVPAGVCRRPRAMAAGHPLILEPADICDLATAVTSPRL